MFLNIYSTTIFIRNILIICTFIFDVMDKTAANHDQYEHIDDPFLSGRDCIRREVLVVCLSIDVRVGEF